MEFAPLRLVDSLKLCCYLSHSTNHSTEIGIFTLVGVFVTVCLVFLRTFVVQVVCGGYCAGVF